MPPHSAVTHSLLIKTGVSRTHYDLRKIIVLFKERRDRKWQHELKFEEIYYWKNIVGGRNDFRSNKRSSLIADNTWGCSVRVEGWGTNLLNSAEDVFTLLPKSTFYLVGNLPLSSVKWNIKFFFILVEIYVKSFLSLKHLTTIVTDQLLSDMNFWKVSEDF